MDIEDFHLSFINVHDCIAGVVAFVIASIYLIRILEPGSAEAQYPQVYGSPCLDSAKVGQQCTGREE